MTNPNPPVLPLFLPALIPPPRRPKSASRAVYEGLNADLEYYLLSRTLFYALPLFFTPLTEELAVFRTLFTLSLFFAPFSADQHQSQSPRSFALRPHSAFGILPHHLDNPPSCANTRAENGFFVFSLLAFPGCKLIFSPFQSFDTFKFLRNITLLYFRPPSLNATHYKENLL